MQCHECGRAVVPGQRFCTGCGTSLAGVTDLTHVVPTVDDGHDGHDGHDGDASSGDIGATGAGPAAASDVHEPTQAVDTVAPDTAEAQPEDSTTEWARDPIWAATGQVPAAPSHIPTAQLPATELVTELAPESTPIIPAVPDVPPARPTASLTEQVPTSPPTTQIQVTAAPAVPPAPPRFLVTSVTVVGFLAAVLALVSMFATMLEITTTATRPPTDDLVLDFRVGTWLIGDLGDNLPIAGLIAAVLMACGSVAAGLRWRWGAGLAGGAGLAFAGIAAVAIGLAQIPIAAAQEFAAIPSEEEFTISITRDLGYWLLIVAGAIAAVVFFASLNHALGDRRSGLNPWIAALGALAAVIAVAGPLLPEGLAVFSDNWYRDDVAGATPALLLTGRLVQLGLLGLTGVFGFLTVRRYGLGLAIGGMLPMLWMAASVLFEIGDTPIGPGYRNPGADDTHLHAVTMIGLGALASMAILAAIAAYDQAVRDRH